MKGVKGTLVLCIDDKSFTYKVDNLIFVDDTNKNGIYDVNQMVTEDCVFGIIENEMRDKNIKGSIHEIIIYDEYEKLIAYSDNSKNNKGKLRFNITRL